MFGHKKETENNGSKTAKEQSSLKGPAGENPSLNVGNFPVHTMKDDLKNWRAGIAPVIENRKEIKKEDVFEKGDVVKDDNTKKSGLGKALIYIIIILIIAVVAAAGYYFWTTRIRNISSFIPTQNNNATSNPSGSNSSNNTGGLGLSQSSANYLSVDLANFDENTLKKTLNDDVQKLKSANVSGPIEFIVTDNSNAPLNFSDFAQKINLGLPQTVLSQLNESFSLYVYLDNGNPRLGISIASKNPSALQAALLSEEGSLVKDVRPLFLENNYTLQDSYIFNSSSYKGNSVRYANVVSPSELSVDYAVSDGQLFIGTTKETLRSILDYSAKNATAPSTSTDSGM